MPLRVRSLELHGYKTFAARTFFEFAPGITAIVGPNGAGKSNIADALRWVLGEQSYSLLRGKKTEDMIFSGSEHRPRAGMASAEVMFDNSTEWLPLDFGEVAMTRRAYRDGHNDYLLNGQHVRLREMNELLASAGLSERTYTIVGQGLVDASLALKADERRRLFEEAAGVGLYRVRREEALRRLETTQRNLERVQDIINEIEPRLKSLERQAKRAREYATAQADLRETLREWYGYHWHRAQEELQSSQTLVQSLQEKSQEASRAFEDARNTSSTFRARLAARRGQLSEWGHGLAKLREEREAVRLELAVLDERRRTLSGSATELAAELQLLANDEGLARDRMLAFDAEISEREKDLEEILRQLQDAQQALEDRRVGRGSIEEAISKARVSLTELSAQKAEALARKDALDAQAKGLNNRLSEEEQAITEVEEDLRRAREDLHAAVASREQAEADAQAARAAVGVARKHLESQQGKGQQLIEERGELRARQSATQAHLGVIEQASRSMIGYAEGARFLLQAADKKQLLARGALGEALELPADLEIAIGAALGDAVDGVVLDPAEVDRALGLLESPEAGRAVLIPLGLPPVGPLAMRADPDLVGVAAELVKAPAELGSLVARLLGTTIIVRSRAAARRLLPAVPVHGRIVTLRGEVFRGDGLISAGKHSGIPSLSRQREKRELSEVVESVAAQLKEIDSRIAKSEDDQRSASAGRDRAELDAQSAQEAIESARQAEHLASAEVERLTRLLEWHSSRHQELVDEKAQAQALRRALLNEIDNVEAKHVRAQAEGQRLAQDLESLGVEELQNQVRYWETRRTVTEQNLSNLRERRLEQEAALGRSQARTADLRQRSEQGEAASDELLAERTDLAAREAAVLAGIEAAEKEIAPAEQAMLAAELEETGLQESETAAQRAAASAERILNQAEIDLVRRQEALDSLRGRIVDDFGLVAFEYASTVEGPVPLPFDGLVEQLPRITSVSQDLEDQLAQRRARVRRLGLINPEARNEFASESERYSFLTTQVRDLRQAEDDLRQVISELDDLTRREFANTYAAVDKQFRAIFTRLFGGGSAHLSLTDPENLVETGIEIEARLPGRREQGLSLLSGGERSLTAIALVFALLKVSPTPVCVMDEVDAMLDEANVGRFRDLLKELSQETQFIIITHNRNTVQAADYIYGVTMGRDSTSQIISLRLDEVSEEMLGASRG
jgi:chromosome segregation protein